MNPQKIKNIFGGIVGVIYVLVGIWAIIDKNFIGIPINATASLLVGMLMIAYGCFRVYRAVKNE